MKDPVPSGTFDLFKSRRFAPGEETRTLGQASAQPLSNIKMSFPGLLTPEPRQPASVFPPLTPRRNEVVHIALPRKVPSKTRAMQPSRRWKAAREKRGAVEGLRQI